MFTQVFNERIGMDASDPRLLRLPHPRRYELARRAERRLAWIEPVLVNKSALGGEPASKPYAVG